MAKGTHPFPKVQRPIRKVTRLFPKGPRPMPLETRLQSREARLLSLELRLQRLEARHFSLEAGHFSPKPPVLARKTPADPVLPMKIITLDSGFYLDDPNNRWGNPCYQLEPGDPGYVPYVRPKTKPKNKAKNMKHNSYFPTKLALQIPWLVNFPNKLTGLATPLGLSPAQVAGAVADCGWLVYVLQNWLTAVRTWAAACTDAALEAQSGTGPTPLVLPVFTPPALPSGVAAALPGALDRIFALVKLIKDSGRCTDAMATDLGIVGSEEAAPDLSTVQPVISAKASGSEVNLKWGWQGLVAWLDACEIMVERGVGTGYVPLIIDTTPNYTDTHPFPATKQIWTYKAIYRLNDRQVGLWSQPVSVTVVAG